LLNYCGIKYDLVDYVVDANPWKQNKWLPASHIPVVDEAYLKKDRPDFVIILPWNLQTEIRKQLEYIRDWNGKFVIPIPQLQLV
ncbi:MAG: methyltransferase C-terminal domain-containing protein, partial [Flavisolibacter sp.]